MYRPSGSELRALTQYGLERGNELATQGREEMIQRTMDQPAEFKRRKEQKEMRGKLAKKVEAKLNMLRKRYTCAEASPCGKKGAPKKR